MALRTGRVIIAKNIKLDKDYNDVLTYSESDMLNLVIQNKIAESSNCSFIKVGENTIDTPFSYGDSLKSNYMALQNPNYSNKWFFCFVNKVEYLNKLTTRIYYTVDEFSTWYDYWIKEDCLVIREHVNDDTVGVHTLQEDVELGDYIVNERFRGRSFKDNDCVVLGTVLDLSTAPKLAPNNPYSFKSGTQLGGVYGGVTYYTFSDIAILDIYLASIMLQGQQDGIISIFMSDGDLFSKTAVYTDTNFTVYKINDSVNHTVTPWEVTGTDAPTKPTEIDGYTPKNKKLLTYPFVFLYADNNCGSSATYKYELFEDRQDNKILFNFYSVVCPGMDMKLVPLSYKGQNDAYNEGIVLGKFPVCSWLNDTYINQLTQQCINNTDPTALIDYFMTPYKFYPTKPPQLVGNSNNGNVAYASNHITVDLYAMSIKREFAIYIDNYLSKYGYKVNRIKSPNLTGRSNYNYLLIGEKENIGYHTSSTYVPAESMEIINNIFRRGVTLWHNHANLGDYSVTNNIVS